MLITFWHGLDKGSRADRLDQEASLLWGLIEGIWTFENFNTWEVSMRASFLGFGRLVRGPGSPGRADIQLRYGLCEDRTFCNFSERPDNCAQSTIPDEGFPASTFKRSDRGFPTFVSHIPRWIADWIEVPEESSHTGTEYHWELEHDRQRKPNRQSPLERLRDGSKTSNTVTKRYLDRIQSFDSLRLNKRRLEKMKQGRETQPVGERPSPQLGSVRKYHCLENFSMLICLFYSLFRLLVPFCHRRLVTSTPWAAHPSLLKLVNLSPRRTLPEYPGEYRAARKVRSI
jgi:hypothetical protein